MTEGTTRERRIDKSHYSRLTFEVQKGVSNIEKYEGNGLDGRQLSLVQLSAGKVRRVGSRRKNCSKVVWNLPRDEPDLFNSLISSLYSVKLLLVDLESVLLLLLNGKMFIDPTQTFPVRNRNKEELHPKRAGYSREVINLNMSVEVDTCWVSFV